MNWYKKSQQQYLWNNDPQLPYATMDRKTKEYWETKYPIHKNQKNDNVPNLGSISASLNDYEILSGIRDVSILDFGTGGYANLKENLKSKNLAEEIKRSGHISPLIVVIDNDGPYILEGGHRLQALQQLDYQSFPALVVLDKESLIKESNNELV